MLPLAPIDTQLDFANELRPRTRRRAEEWPDDPDRAPASRHADRPDPLYLALREAVAQARAPFARLGSFFRRRRRRDVTSPARPAGRIAP